MTTHHGATYNTERWAHSGVYLLLPLLDFLLPSHKKTGAVRKTCSKSGGFRVPGED